MCGPHSLSGQSRSAGRPARSRGPESPLDFLHNHTSHRRQLTNRNISSGTQRLISRAQVLVAAAQEQPSGAHPEYTLQQPHKRSHQRSPSSIYSTTAIQEQLSLMAHQRGLSRVYSSRVTLQLPFILCQGTGGAIRGVQSILYKCISYCINVQEGPSEGSIQSMYTQLMLFILCQSKRGYNREVNPD